MFSLRISFALLAAIGAAFFFLSFVDGSASEVQWQPALLRPVSSSSESTCAFAGVSEKLALQLQVGITPQLASLDLHSHQVVERRKNSSVQILSAYEDPKKTLLGVRFGPQDGRRVLLHLAKSSITRYAKRHGYGFAMVRNVPLVTGREAPWGRVSLLAKLIDATADRDDAPAWYLWIDSDVLCLRPDALPSEWLSDGPDLRASMEEFKIAQSPRNINSGVLLVRNTRRVLPFLDELYVYGDFADKRDRWLWEQDCLIALVRGQKKYWSGMFGLLEYRGKSAQRLSAYFTVDESIPVRHCHLNETFFCHMAGTEKLPRLAATLEGLSKEGKLTDFLLKADVQLAARFVQQFLLPWQLIAKKVAKTQIMEGEMLYNETVSGARRFDGVEQGVLLSSCRYSRSDLHRVPDVSLAALMRKNVLRRADLSNPLLVSWVATNTSSSTDALWRGLSEYAKSHGYGLSTFYGSFALKGRSESWAKLVVLRLVIVNLLSVSDANSGWVVWIDSAILKPPNGQTPALKWMRHMESSVFTACHWGTHVVIARVSEDSLALLDLWWRAGSWSNSELLADGDSTALRALLRSAARTKFLPYFGVHSGENGDWPTAAFLEEAYRGKAVTDAALTSLTEMLPQADSFRQKRDVEIRNVANRLSKGKTPTGSSEFVTRYASSSLELIGQDTCLGNWSHHMLRSSREKVNYTGWCLGVVARSCNDNSVHGMALVFRRIWDGTDAIFAHIGQKRFVGLEKTHYAGFSCNLRGRFGDMKQKWGVLGRAHRDRALKLDKLLRESLWFHLRTK